MNMNMKIAAPILTIGAIVAWAVSLGATMAQNIVPDPPVCRQGEGQSTKADMVSVLQWATAPSPSPSPVASNNCASVGSCGRLGCYRIFGGGSQYVMDNAIPACLNNKRDCYDVKCNVATYNHVADCTGPISSHGWTEARGCRSQPK